MVFCVPWPSSSGVLGHLISVSHGFLGNVIFLTWYPFLQGAGMSFQFNESENEYCGEEVHN